MEVIYIIPPDSGVLIDEDGGGLMDSLSGKQQLASAQTKLTDKTVITTVGKDNKLSHTLKDVNIEDENEPDNELQLPVNTCVGQTVSTNKYKTIHKILKEFRLISRLKVL